MGIRMGIKDSRAPGSWSSHAPFFGNDVARFQKAPFKTITMAGCHLGGIPGIESSRPDIRL